MTPDMPTESQPPGSMQRVVRLRELREWLETSMLKSYGACLACRGYGMRSHRSVGGTGIIWTCEDCNGTGKQPNAEVRGGAPLSNDNTAWTPRRPLH